MSSTKTTPTCICFPFSLFLPVFFARLCYLHSSCSGQSTSFALTYPLLLLSLSRVRDKSFSVPPCLLVGEGDGALRAHDPGGQNAGETHHQPHHRATGCQRGIREGDFDGRRERTSQPNRNKTHVNGDAGGGWGILEHDSPLKLLYIVCSSLENMFLFNPPKTPQKM